jgi:hypothetical protein
MQTSSLELPAQGLYQLSITYTDYLIGVQPGTATAALSFDTRNADFNPPAILSAIVVQEGRFTDTLSPGNPAYLLLSLNDENPIPLVRVEADTGSGWQTLTGTCPDQTCQFTLPSLPAYQYMHLKITLEDYPGNRLVLTITPALLGEGNYQRFFPLIDW